MTLYTISVDMPSDLPEDVVSEYIGVALKKFVAERTRVTVRLEEPAKMSKGGVISGAVYNLPKAMGGYSISKEQAAAIGFAPFRNHPFEGPEVFDDEVTPETFTVTPQAYPGITEEFPHLSEVLSQKRDSLKRSITDAPPAEGDWQLDANDKVGED